MTITTVQGLIAGLLPPERLIRGTAINLNTQNVWVTNVYQSGGYPGAMAVPSSGAAGAAITSRTGLISFTNPPSGETRLARLLARVNGGSSQGAFGLLIDRLWDNSGLSAASTSTQTVNSATLPARDINESTNGEGVYLGIEVSTGLTSANPTMTATYTNSAGTGSKAATYTPVTATPAAGSFGIFGLDAGDTGIRSVQDLTLSAAYASGVFHLVLFRPIAMVFGMFAAQTVGRSQPNNDAISLVAPKLPDNHCLQMLWLSAGNFPPNSPFTEFTVSQG